MSIFNERIYTIPISEVFEPKSGCPICRMRDMLEERCVDYVLGAAMMEPDVRVETNRLGFCREHLGQMQAKQKRLSLALLLETRLAELKKRYFGKGGLPKQALNPTCFICSSIGEAMERMIDNIIKMYSENPAFQALFAKQEVICLPHYEQLAACAVKKMPKKQIGDFAEQLNRLTGEYLRTLTADVHYFTTRFDYRFGGKDADWGSSKDSIERAVWFTTSKKL